MSVQMPELDQAVLRRREQIVAALRAIVPGEGVIAAEREMRPYESDGLTAYRALPMVVVLPGGSAWDPIGKAYKRLELGDSEYIPAFFAAAAASVGGAAGG